MVQFMCSISNFKIFICFNIGGRGTVKKDTRKLKLPLGRGKILYIKLNLNIQLCLKIL